MVATRTLMPYAAVLAAALTLGACSGGDPSPPSWASTANGGETTSATSGSVPPSGAPTTSGASTAAEDPVLARIPQEARAETAEGAAAFVQFYFAQLNKAFRAADQTMAEALATDQCKICVAMLEGVKEVRSKGRHYQSDLITVEKVTPMDFVSTNRRMLVGVKQNHVKVLDAGGTVVDTVPAGSGQYVFTLDYPGHWRVTRVQEAKS